VMRSVDHESSSTTWTTGSAPSPRTASSIWCASCRARDSP
jgi:hypothetical protein